MRRIGRVLLMAALIAVPALAPAPTAVLGQQGPLTTCSPASHSTVFNVGAVDAQGVTREDKLASAGEKHGYAFTLTKMSAAFIYVGDQWYDLDLYLYPRALCPPDTWSGFIGAWSIRAERRTLQFVRPDEVIISPVPPGDYLLLVGHKFGEDPQYAGDFDPSRGFTIRVAASPPVCGLEPQNVLTPFPTEPSVISPKRPDNALYQLGMTIDPPDPGPFSLMSFNAIVSPPYTDLFDYKWELDGKPVPDGTTPTIMTPSAALAKTPDGTHRARVTATGARQYPDPEQPHIPPTISLECTFKVGTS